MAGGDFASAAALMELEMPALRRDRREATMRGWLEGLPDEVLRVRPVLCNDLAGARLSTGTIEGVEDLLDDAERWLDATEGGTAPGRHGRRGPGRVPPAAGRGRRPPCRAGPRAGRRRRHGRLRPARARPRAWRTTTSRAVPPPRCAGLAAWTTGDLEVAHASYAACLVDFERIGPRLRRARLLASRSPTSRWPRVGCARRCAPSSRRWSSPPATAAGSCAARWTCTSAGPRSTGSSATWPRPGAT